MNRIGREKTTRKYLSAMHYESKEIRHFSKPKLSLQYKGAEYLYNYNMYGKQKYTNLKFTSTVFK